MLILLNKEEYRPSLYRNLLGYVPQAYLVFKELTVFENLYYAANLRLARDTPNRKERIEHLVEESLELLRLNDCRHFVCDPQLGERMSGGQMRRVSIGIELCAIRRCFCSTSPQVPSMPSTPGL